MRANLTATSGSSAASAVRTLSRAVDSIGDAGVGGGVDVTSDGAAGTGGATCVVVALAVGASKRSGSECSSAVCETNEIQGDMRTRTHDKSKSKIKIRI